MKLTESSSRFGGKKGGEADLQVLLFARGEKATPVTYLSKAAGH